MRFQKRQLRNEYRKAPRRAPRREIGRSPNWVYREKKDALSSVQAELAIDTTGE